MRRLPLIVAGVLALLLGTSTALPADSRARPDTGGSHAYGPGPRQQLIAYRHRGAPASGLSQPGPSRAAAGRPGVVVLHGGFWFLGRSPGWKTWAQRIADSGTVVFDVDYRRNVDAPWPAQREDVLRALRWIRRHAAGFGVDTRRLVLLGSSAGGQLATNVAAYGAGRERVAGAVALSPVVDPYRAWSDGGGGAGEAGPGRAVLRASAARLAGCDPRRGRAAEREQCRRVWRDMSAVHHASGDDAPMLLVHSRRDFVPAFHSRALHRAERREGMAADEVRVVTVPGAEHGGGLLRDPDLVGRVLGWIHGRGPRGGGAGPPERTAGTAERPTPGAGGAVAPPGPAHGPYGGPRP